MKQKHMYSLLDQTFTTVRVVFGTGLLRAPLEFAELPPGHYSATIEDVQLGGAAWVDPRSPRGKRPSEQQRKDEERIRMSLRVQHDASRDRSYVYKVPKSWDVRAGQHLVVLDPGNDLAVVNVIEVHAEPEIDVDANYSYKWAVSKVDTTEYHELCDKEKAFGDQLMHIERVKQRESLMKSFMETLPEGSEARRLFEQTTASLAAPTVEQPPVQGN